MPVCQFTILRAAADAIDLATLRERARAAGIEPARFEASTINAGSGKVRITCSSEIAKFFVDVLTGCAAVATTADLKQACLDGVAAAIAELQQPEYGMTEGIKPNYMGR